jgi:hypothetical protein
LLLLVVAAEVMTQAVVVVLVDCLQPPQHYLLEPRIPLQLVLVALVQQVIRHPQVQILVFLV